MLLHVPDNRRREVTLAVGLVGTFLGVFGILDFIEGFLSCFHSLFALLVVL